MTDEAAEKPRIKQDHNPWYLLATLYGQSSRYDYKLQTKNRVAWNRYMASRMIGEELRAHLAKVTRRSAEELTPFSDVELEAAEAAFAERTFGNTRLADLSSDQIDFANSDLVDFCAGNLIFPTPCDFCNVTFSGEAYFENAIFVNAVDFRNATFSGDADFANATFSGRNFFGSSAVFSDATFSKRADFRNATFSNNANFWGATFSDEAYFERVRFSREAQFRNATFRGWRSPDFSDATFSGEANFQNATFAGPATFRNAAFEWADFREAKFSDAARFGRAAFSVVADFRSGSFSGEADFERATFPKVAYFQNATFAGEADFQRAAFSGEADFVNAKMKDVTLFVDAAFAMPPRFFNAELHEGTVWRGVTWPEPPKDAANASLFLIAYERLKLEMDRLKKHEDEHDFFARELQCRRVLLRDWQPISELKVFGYIVPIQPLKIPETTIGPRCLSLFGRRFALPLYKIPAREIRLLRPAGGLSIAMYGFLCDYGRSYVRPGTVLLGIVAIGALPFWMHLGVFELWQAIGLSFANTLGALGVRKDFIDPDVIKSLPTVLKVIGVMQTGLGIVLLFLFSLGLRNRFRMK